MVLKKIVGKTRPAQKQKKKGRTKTVPRALTPDALRVAKSFAFG